jgi:integrase
MQHVDRPGSELAPRQFYDAATVLQIVRAQPTIERAAFFALVYGTGADVSPAVALQKGDVNSVTREVRIAGTKSAARDRLVRVNEALWPVFWKHSKLVLSGNIFPGRDRFIVSDWHRQTVGNGTKDTHGKIVMQGLGLKMRLPLRCARHHFAVRLLQAGAPIQIVAQQLGSDQRTVLKHYGVWAASSDDRARWEKEASKHARQR